MITANLGAPYPLLAQLVTATLPKTQEKVTASQETVVIQLVQSTGSSQPLPLFPTTVLLQHPSPGHLAEGRNLPPGLPLWAQAPRGGSSAEPSVREPTCARVRVPLTSDHGTLICATLFPAPVYLLLLPAGPATSGVCDAASFL